MADIIHRIGIQAPISKVYAALSTLEGVAAGGHNTPLAHPRLEGRWEFVSILRREKKSAP